jgi:hypothetical protein
LKSLSVIFSIFPLALLRPVSDKGSSNDGTTPAKAGQGSRGTGQSREPSRKALHGAQVVKPQKG